MGGGGAARSTLHVALPRANWADVRLMPTLFIVFKWNYMGRVAWRIAAGRECSRAETQ